MNPSMALVRTKSPSDEKLFCREGMDPSWQSSLSEWLGRRYQDEMSRARGLVGSPVHHGGKWGVVLRIAIDPSHGDGPVFLVVEYRSHGNRITGHGQVPLRGIDSVPVTVFSPRTPSSGRTLALGKRVRVIDGKHYLDEGMVDEEIDSGAGQIPLWGVALFGRPVRRHYYQAHQLMVLD